MANRIVGNVYILDSQEAATIPLSWPVNTGAKIKTAAFWSADTTGAMTLTMGNASNPVVQFSYISQAAAAGSGAIIVNATQYITFGDGIYFDQLAVTKLVQGTGWLFFA